MYLRKESTCWKSGRYLRNSCPSSPQNQPVKNHPASRPSPFLALLLAFLLAMPCWACAADKAFKTDPGTVALWNFGEGSEDTSADEASTSIELRPQKGADQEPPRVVDGKFGKALFFPGAASLIGSKRMPIETPEQVTLEVWLKLDPEGENTNRGVFQYMRYGECGFRMGINPSGRVDWLTEDGTKEIGVTGNVRLPSDEWVHVAGTYDGTTMRIFINGEQDSEKPVAGGNPQGQAPVFVGVVSAGPPPYFRGTIQAIRISNVALTKFDLK